MSDKDVQVQILLVPRQTKYRIPDTPILVPGRLQRYGLSEIVNHLLGLDKPVPFDFLIDNQFLRKSLLEYLQENGVSLETVVTIEYIESMLPPKQLASADQGDWISSISTLDEHFLVASYDGTVCVRNTSLECESTLSGGHRGLPVKATAAIPGDSRTRFVSSGQDNTVVGWGVIEGGGNEPGPLYRGMGHTGSVDSVCANQMGTH
ncbi:ribosome biogenesis protein ytm1, partial [Spiromyces aspiralis]